MKSPFIVAGSLINGQLFYRATPKLYKAMKWFNAIEHGRILQDGSTVRERGDYTPELVQRLLRHVQSLPHHKR